MSAVAGVLLSILFFKSVLAFLGKVVGVILALVVVWFVMKLIELFFKGEL